MSVVRCSSYSDNQIASVADVCWMQGSRLQSLDMDLLPLPSCNLFIIDWRHFFDALGRQPSSQPWLVMPLRGPALNIRLLVDLNVSGNLHQMKLHNESRLMLQAIKLFNLLNLDLKF